MVTINTNVTLQLSALYQKESAADSSTSDFENKTNNDDFNLNSQIKISAEGKEKLKKEQDDLDTSIKNKIKEQAEKTTDKIDESEKKDILDKLIEDIQKQIKELQKKIKALSNDNTEAAKTQKQALEGQLISLSSALMDLIGKKMDSLKA